MPSMRRPVRVKSVVVLPSCGFCLRAEPLDKLAYRKSEELLQISGNATYRELECAHTCGKDRRIIAAVETRIIPSSAQSFRSGRVYNPAKEPASIPAPEVKTIEQEYVSPAGWRNFSHCRGRSRPAARLQMGGDCRRLAGSDVGKCGRPCDSDLSCVCRPSERTPGKLVPHRATVLVDHDREA
jgi:hypothetical protein